MSERARENMNERINERASGTYEVRASLHRGGLSALAVSAEVAVVFLHVLPIVPSAIGAGVVGVDELVPGWKYR